MGIRFYIFIAILLALDFYAFQAIKTLTKNYWIQGLYFLISLSILGYLVYTVVNYDRSVGPNKESLRVAGIFLLFFVPKLVLLLFMFGEDIVRVIVGGYKNHVHILCLLSRKMAQMKLLEEVKKGSSKWIKTQGAQYSNFYWQNGYGIFSVNPTQIDKVERYIENQEQHHSKKGFKEEFRALLKKYDIDYDERYVWD